MEGRRAFLIRSARRVHKGAPERHECLGEELAIADIASGCDCLAHPLDTGFDRPAPRAPPRLPRGWQGRRPAPRLACRRGDVYSATAARERGCRVDAQLAPKELRARGDVARGRFVVAARAQTADEQDVGVFVVGVQPDELRCTRGLRSPSRPARAARARPGGGRRSSFRRYAGARSRARARSRGSNGRRGRPEARGRDRGARRPPSRSRARVRRRRRTSQVAVSVERVSAELRVVAQPAAESGKRPPERSQRVVRLGEEEAREALARRREPRAQEVGEQAPRFVAPWRLSPEHRRVRFWGEPSRWMLRLIGRFFSSNASSHASL